MKLVKKIILIIVTIILTLLISYNIYSFVCINILGKELVTINGYAILEVVSGSMEPEIKIGDMIIINTKEQDFKKGNVVTYHDSNNSLVTHRIISIEGNEIITKGDNNNTEDNPIYKSEIVGRALYKMRNAGRIIASIRSPLTMVMIFIIGVLVCIFTSIESDEKIQNSKEFIKYLEKKEKETEKKKEVTKTTKKTVKKNTSEKKK